MDRLKTLLNAVGVTYSERVFDSEEGVAELGGNVFVSNYIFNHCDSPSVCFSISLVKVCCISTRTNHICSPHPHRIGMQQSLYYPCMNPMLVM